jgi:hypothetical protein
MSAFPTRFQPTGVNNNFNIRQPSPAPVVSNNGFPGTTGRTTANFGPVTTGQQMIFLPPSGTGNNPLNLNYNLPGNAGINAPSAMMGGNSGGGGQNMLQTMLSTLLSSLKSSQGSSNAQTTTYLQSSGLYQVQPMQDDTSKKADDSGYWAALGYSDEGGAEGQLQADPPPPKE